MKIYHHSLYSYSGTFHQKFAYCCSQNLKITPKGIGPSVSGNDYSKAIYPREMKFSIYKYYKIFSESNHPLGTSFFPKS